MSIKTMSIWKHNSFQGYAAMMMKQCDAIIQSKTATYEAKKIAAEIRDKAINLRLELRQRIDK